MREGEARHADQDRRRRDHRGGLEDHLDGGRPAAAIKPGQFQEFDVSLGPLPEVDQIVFKALQTYSDGEVVRWIEEPASGQEPEYPAPVLKLTKAQDDGTAASPAADDDDAVSVAAQSDNNAGNGTAIGLGAAGLAAGVIALVVALLAWRRSRSA